MTALADRYVAEYKKVYPISYTFSGLPIERHDGVDINSPADIARFREFQQSMWILGEQPSWQDYVALALILVALSTVLLPSRPTR